MNEKIKQLRKIQQTVNDPEFRAFHFKYIEMLGMIEEAVGDGYDPELIIQCTVEEQDDEDHPYTLEGIIKLEKEDSIEA